MCRDFVIVFLRYERECFTMENEMEYYKNLLIGIINSINDLDILVYLCRLIENIVKAGR